MDQYDRSKTTIAHFTLGDTTRYSFGDRWSFGIECEVEARKSDSRPYPGEPVGSFWYWISGEVVGNPQEVDILVIAFGVVLDALKGAEKRPDKRFLDLSAVDKLDLVDWARFGEDESPEAERWRYYGREGFEPYRIIPKDGGPWFDGWEGILTESRDDEVIVWRRADQRSVSQRVLPKGLFVKVASEFCDWFKSFREQGLRRISAAETRDTVGGGGA